MTWAAGPERTSCRSVLERGVGAKRCAALVASHRTARPTSLHEARLLLASITRTSRISPSASTMRSWAHGNTAVG